MSARLPFKAFLLICLAVALVLFVAFGNTFSLQARASGIGDLSGWAWSDTIGWISFSGTTYGVTVDQNGNLGGYAWSDSVGWISFNSGSGGDAYSCYLNNGGTPAEMINGVLQGWAKVLSTDNTWDGCISLGKQSGDTVNYGPSIPGGSNQTGTFDGYAWGSTNVGWISFNCDSGGPTGNNICATSNYAVQVTFQNPIGTLFNPNFVANPPRVVKGGTTYLTWDASASMASCSGVTDQNGNFVPGSAVLAASGMQVPTTITRATTFTLTCQDSQGTQYTAQASAGIEPVFEEI